MCWHIVQSGCGGSLVVGSSVGVTGNRHLLGAACQHHRLHAPIGLPTFPDLCLPCCATWPVCSTSDDVGAGSCAANDLASTVEVSVESGKHYFIVVGSTSAVDPFPLQLAVTLQSL